MSTLERSNKEKTPIVAISGTLKPAGIQYSCDSQGLKSTRGTHMEHMANKMEIVKNRPTHHVSQLYECFPVFMFRSKSPRLIIPFSEYSLPISLVQVKRYVATCRWLLLSLLVSRSRSHRMNNRVKTNFLDSRGRRGFRWWCDVTTSPFSFRSKSISTSLCRTILLAQQTIHPLATSHLHFCDVPFHKQIY